MMGNRQVTTSNIGKIREAPAKRLQKLGGLYRRLFGSYLRTQMRILQRQDRIAITSRYDADEKVLLLPWGHGMGNAGIFGVEVLLKSFSGMG